MLLPWHKQPKELPSKAVAYYRHSAQDRQENSVDIQREQVQAFAKENGITIIREFIDRGISGLSTEGRDGFNEMLDDYVVGGKEDFDFVLVLDVSRWGRFQDSDLSAYYSGICAKHGKKVVFTSIGFPKKDDGLLHGLHMSIERYRAASYSKELSGKVWKGCSKIASDGYWAGGMPPYGMHRLLLDEERNPVRVLKHGEHKAIHNQRVTLVPGDGCEVDVVQRIFHAIADDGLIPVIDIRARNGWSPKDAKEVKQIPMKAEVQEVLRRRERECNGGYLFQNSRGNLVAGNHSLKRLKRLFPLVGIDMVERRLYWHSWRNYFVVVCLDSGVKPHRVMHWTGHDSYQMVMRYANSRDGDRMGFSEFKKLM